MSDAGAVERGEGIQPPLPDDALRDGGWRRKIEQRPTWSPSPLRSRHAFAGLSTHIDRDDTWTHGGELEIKSEKKSGDIPQS
jgi:hypothetical protein